MRQSGVFLFLFLLAFPAFAASDRGSLCVQTFNVYGPAYASQVSDRLDRLAETLLREPCDAIQLQELWKENHYAQFVADMSPARMAAFRADDARADRNITGLATLTRGSILRAHSALYAVNNEDGLLDWIRDLSGVEKGFTILEARFDHLETPVLLVNTHTHPMDEAIRVAQMIELVSAVYATGNDAPLLFTADLNATPDSLDVELVKKLLLLEDAYLAAGNSYAGICTYCGDNPLSWSRKDRVIDYVFYRSSPTFAWHVESAEVNLKGDAYGALSDHYGVRSYLSWEARPEALLEPDSDLVRSRKTDAILVLRKAISILARQRDSAFAPILQKARELEAMFRGKLSPSVERIFRIL